MLSLLLLPVAAVLLPPLEWAVLPLDAAVLAALGQFRFKLPLMANQPVAITGVTESFIFRLTNDDSPPEPQPDKPPIEPLRQVAHAKTIVDIPRFNPNTGTQIHNNGLGGYSF